MNIRPLLRKAVQDTTKLLTKLDTKLEPNCKQQIIMTIDQLPPEVLVDTLKFIEARLDKLENDHA